MNRAVIYTRTSKEKQDESDLLRQLAKTAIHCKKSDWEIAAHFHDNYPAKNFKRPQWKVLLEGIKNNKTKTDFIVVSKIDRFSRNAFETHKMIKILEKHNVKVYSIAENQFLTIEYGSFKTEQNDSSSNLHESID